MGSIRFAHDNEYLASWMKSICRPPLDTVQHYVSASYLHAKVCEILETMVA
jgi:hypothetical protein